MRTPQEGQRRGARALQRDAPGGSTTGTQGDRDREQQAPHEVFVVLAKQSGWVCECIREVAVKVVLQAIRVQRSTKTCWDWITAWLENHAGREREGVSYPSSNNAGAKPEKLSKVAIVIGEASEHQSKGEKYIAETVIPSICRMIRWFDACELSEVIVYDLEGFAKTQWRRAIEKDLRSHPNGPPQCAIQFACYTDWRECVASAVISLAGSEVAEAKTWADGVIAEDRLDHMFRSHEAKGMDDTGVGVVGPPPDIILVASDNAFSLEGFLPWHTRAAEIYHVRGMTTSRKGTLERELGKVLQRFFGTNQRFGV